MNLYSHSQWVRFREEVVKLDAGQCVRCFRGRADGVVLQVHHKGYAPGRKPWEYDYTDCETLCKGCHAEERGLIMPQTGWTLVGTDDLEDLCGNCELCGTQLRYAYAIMHPIWGHWKSVQTVAIGLREQLTQASTIAGLQGLGRSGSGL